MCPFKETDPNRYKLWVDILGYCLVVWNVTMRFCVLAMSGLAHTANVCTCTCMYACRIILPGAHTCRDIKQRKNSKKTYLFVLESCIRVQLSCFGSLVGKSICLNAEVVGSNPTQGSS